MDIPLEERHRPEPQEAFKQSSVPLRFIQALNRLLETSGISPIVHSPRRLPASYAADEGEALKTGPSADLPARIGRVVIFIDEHLEGPLSLDRLADEADLSKYYFARLFREEVGQPPWAYVREARLQKAKMLLVDGASPAAAALEAGFFDQSHLTNVMKALEEKTPRQYQREQDRKDLQE